MALYEECKDYYIRPNEATTDEARQKETALQGRPRTANGGGAAETHKRSLEDLVFAESVGMYEMVFEQQFHYGKQRFSLSISPL